MALDEPVDNEKPVQVNGIDVLITDMHRSMVDSTVIDYVDGPSGTGFLVKGASSC